MVDKYKISEIGPKNSPDGFFINRVMVDNINDFHFSAILIDGKSIFDCNSTEFEKIVNYIISEYRSKVNNFVAIEDISEAFLSTSRYMFDISHPNLKLLVDIFKNNNLLSRLVWRSNGVNPEFKTEMKFQPITHYLGLDIHMCFDIEPRKFSHTFLSLYRTYKEIREEFHCFLEQSGIINKTLYSYNSAYETKSPWTYDYNASLDGVPVLSNMIMMVGEYFKNTFCSIVYEAFWHEDTVFFTEKLNKCLVTGHPFIIVSTPRYLSFLKKLGFKTFDKWWDESYDLILDNREREIKLKQLILKISEWSIEKCEETYIEMIPILKHNQDLVKEIASKKINVGYSLLEFKSDII